MTRLRHFIAFSLLLVTPAMQAAPPAVEILDTAFSPDGKLNLHWNSAPGQMQQIQVSSDLIHWTNLPPIYTSAFADSAWSDDGSLTSLFNSQEQRFYRLLLPPA